MKKEWFALAAMTLAACSTPPTQLVNERLDEGIPEKRIYKRVGDTAVELHIFYPGDYDAEATTTYPAAVSIHGGGWTEGPIDWGYGEAEWLSTKGYIGIAVGYRLADQVEISALDCIKDANSAVRWVRLNAEELRIDPERVLTIGHSAGGHLSLATAFFPHFKEESEAASVSSVPNRAIALAPAVELCADPYFQNLLLGQEEATHCSPLDQIPSETIPICLIHGTADEVLPVRYAREFETVMEEAGHPFEAHYYEGGNHCFFYESTEARDYWHKIVEDFIEDF